MNRTVRGLVAALCWFGLLQEAVAEPCLRGVNLSGAEFGPVPGRPNFDYAYPSASEIAHVASLGMTAIRLPFRWERLQPRLGAAFDAAELDRLDQAVGAASASGLTTILDLHNFGYYGGKRIGSTEVPVSAFADVWERLGTHYRDKPLVALSLMNEPYDIQSREWAGYANKAIAAIRKAGARNLLIVPGTAYTGAHSWTADLPTGNNSRDMLAITDPVDHYAFDLHQYLDADFSGRAPECSATEKALAGIDAVHTWLVANNKRGFLGEFAASTRPECLNALDIMATRVNADPQHWIGWTAWSAGPWWPVDYMFNLQPTPSGERPQVERLTRRLNGPNHEPATCNLSGGS